MDGDDCEVDNDEYDEYDGDNGAGDDGGGGDDEMMMMMMLAVMFLTPLYAYGCSHESCSQNPELEP